jgi:hypothetical protein
MINTLAVFSTLGIIILVWRKQIWHLTAEANQR